MAGPLVNNKDSHNVNVKKTLKSWGKGPLKISQATFGL